MVDAPLAAFRMAEGSLSMTGFERQFAEHTQNAREHGDGHRVAVAANALASRAIVATYRGMRRLRGGAGLTHDLRNATAAPLGPPAEQSLKR